MRGLLPPSHVFILFSLSTVIRLWISGNVGASNDLYTICWNLRF